MASINSSSHAVRQAAYRERIKAGIRPVQSPWHWLSAPDVQRLAAEAYRIAAFCCREVSEPACTPDLFVSELQLTFEVLVADAARAAGVDAAPADAATYAAQLRADLPSGWSPQYPVYGVAKASGGAA